MIETLWPIVLAVVGVVAGILLQKYGLGRYQATLDTFLKAIEDGKITKEEVNKIIEALQKAINDDS